MAMTEYVKKIPLARISVTNIVRETPLAMTNLHIMLSPKMKIIC